MELKNDLILRAARGEKTERAPVWVMRQAGRILPQYRRVRSSLSGFIELVKTPQFAAEVTVQPVDLLGVDAAIIFSDILVVPEAMGCRYEMAEAKGPVFPEPLQTQQDVDRLRIADGETDLGYVMEAIRLANRELAGRVPLIGFAGAPWTLLCYMLEGAGSKTFSKARGVLYTQPALAHQALDKITQSTISYLRAQVRAGAHLVQLFDSWAGVLPPGQYSEFSLAYIHKICEAIPEVPITVFAKGAFFALDEMSRLPCSVIGLDWNMPIADARSKAGLDKTLQGNLDPCALYGTFADIEKATQKMLTGFGPSRHIANLGHGVYPDTDPDKVRCFVDTVKAFRHG